jgi:hypothetical protein
MPVVRQQGDGWWYTELKPEGPAQDGDEGPLFDLSILREPRFAAAVLAVVLAQAGVFGYILWDERRKARARKKKA